VAEARQDIECTAFFEVYMGSNRIHKHLARSPTEVLTGILDF